VNPAACNAGVSRPPLNGVRNFIAAIVGLAVTALATPAMAYVVRVTTSIDLEDVADRPGLRRAVESAVDDVLKNAVTFSPTVVQVQNARVVGDRMYILLLIADADGEKVLEAIAAEGPTARDSEGAVASPDEGALPEP
jgi:hypothetical protein